MKLPASFIDELTGLLGEEDTARYLASMEQPYEQGLRANTLKCTPEELRSRLAEEGLQESVPWCENGIYLDGKHTLSASLYYSAGLFYLQEPSAMAPASFLPVEPGDCVLDLCAAPGGKSTALGAKLAGTGVLVANDISPSRAKALLRNIEAFGIANAAVTSESPHTLAQKFSGRFNKVLVDAPCSGEGMFRKDPSIIRNWEQYGSAYYAKLQREILPFAAEMTAPGGMLLYSTCTYSVEEDEGTVQWFLRNHPGWRLLALPKTGGIADGFTIPGEYGEEMNRTARFFPHRLRGEGHFAALLEKNGEPAGREPVSGVNNKIPYSDRVSAEARRAFEQWAEEALAVPAGRIIPAGSTVLQNGTRLSASKIPEPMLAGLRVLRNGLLLGETEHGRFEPSQALAMALKPEAVRQRASLSEEDALRYCKGETLSGDFAGGWVLCEYNGYPLGFAKASGGMLKNKYLKSWRRSR